MPIDPTVALADPASERAISWSTDDVLHYHLATGSGTDPLAPTELRFATEWNTVVLPSFGVVAPGLRQIEPPSLNRPGIDIDLHKILHGSQRIAVHRPIPVSGEAVVGTRVSAIQDKGKSAVVDFETTATSPDGTPLWTSTMGIFARGEGGFGGERGETLAVAMPDRAPDLEVDVPTLPQQALLYRLLGDRNPLHADPEAARAVGFDRPILHGLCTYAMVLRTIVRSVLDDEVAPIGEYTGLFTGIVLPGETMGLKLWDTGIADDGLRHLIAAATVRDRDDAPALSVDLAVTS
ncbi:MaoC/PaaZ C-terminal domain-containing protein [Nakamurella lactea]|uniref:MaoC/PaaZ C-terminal domain-containing protein n=1 Tax=Nakamurella lactea TaxID=459515 RepID=UPI000400A27C|nr:MaoC/PaaZ C-terminal domain-containing protein [Nakamurella lactea]